jgi:hypothetical protein
MIAEFAKIYEWYTTRAASCLERLISIDFTGTVQCDGYSAYDRFASRRGADGRTTGTDGLNLGREAPNAGATL